MEEVGEYEKMGRQKYNWNALDWGKGCSHDKAYEKPYQNPYNTPTQNQQQSNSYNFFQSSPLNHPKPPRRKKTTRRESNLNTVARLNPPSSEVGVDVEM